MDRNKLGRALIPHRYRPKFTEEEAALRDVFDKFFDGLDQLGAMKMVGLVDLRDLDPYVKYWVLKLGEGDLDGLLFCAAVRKFIEASPYEGLPKLMRSWGLLTSSPTDEHVLVTETHRIALERGSPTSTEARN